MNSHVGPSYFPTSTIADVNPRLARSETSTVEVGGQQKCTLVGLLPTCRVLKKYKKVLTNTKKNVPQQVGKHIRTSGLNALTMAMLDKLSTRNAFSAQLGVESKPN